MSFWRQIVCTFVVGAATRLWAQDPASKSGDTTATSGQLPGQMTVEERLRRQDERIAELEAQLKTGAGDRKPAEAAKPSNDGLVHWNELTALGSKLKFYGFARLDAIYDDSRPNNTQVVSSIRSEDESAIRRFRANANAFGGVNPERFASKENREDLTIHPRLTRLGIDLDGPVVASLGDAKVTGKIEIDFYNNGLSGQSESRAAIRMRHAYLKMAWTEWSVLAGQTSDLISPIFPVVNPDLVMWGAGNLGDRRPQLRGEYSPAVGDGKIFVQAAAGLTGADDNQDLDSANTFGSGYRDGETSGLPTLQARIAYRHPTFEKTDFELGVWVHKAWENPDQRFGGKAYFESHGYGLDLTLPIFKNLFWLKGEIWQGENVDDVRGGIFQGINTATGDEIMSRGGWAELGLKVATWYTVSLGYAMDDPVNADVGLGGRAVNRIAYCGNRFYFDPIEFGLDYLYWVTDYVGFKEGDDNRFQAYVSYKF